MASWLGRCKPVLYETTFKVDGPGIEALFIVDATEADRRRPGRPWVQVEK